MKISFQRTQMQVERLEDKVALIEVCYQHNTPVNFGCRIGMCGTCKVTILNGLENVSPKNEEEQLLTHCDNERLGCQCFIMGDVTIE